MDGDRSTSFAIVLVVKVFIGRIDCRRKLPLLLREGKGMLHGSDKSL
jgi:hypothetical protein